MLLSALFLKLLPNPEAAGLRLMVNMTLQRLDCFGKLVLAGKGGDMPLKQHYVATMMVSRRHWQACLTS
jgi:hypothetical protein